MTAMIRYIVTRLHRIDVLTIQRFNDLTWQSMISGFRFGVLALMWLVTPSHIAANPAPGVPEHTNRLAREKSPYLLQHAHNPVDWYPWGEEAFAKARRENKPIFLSIG